MQRLPPTEFTMLFLGNLLPRKGLADLLHALATPPLRAARWRLVVAGGGAAAPLQHMARSLGIDHRIHFTGWLNRQAVNRALAEASALVLPSYHEGLPLVLLEAAALGVPMITTPVGAIPELFTHNHTALLVPPGDRAALAQALHQLLQNPDLAGRLGHNAQALYQRSLTMPAFATRLHALYRHLATA